MKKAMLNALTCYVLRPFIRLITHVNLAELIGENFALESCVTLCNWSKEIDQQRQLAYLFMKCDRRIERLLVLPSILAFIEDVSPLTSSDHGPFPY